MYNLVVGQAPPEAGSRIEGAELIPPIVLAPGLSQVTSDGIVAGLAMRAEDRPSSATDYVNVLRGIASPDAPTSPARSAAGEATRLAPPVAATDDLTQVAPEETRVAPDATPLAPAGSVDDPPRSRTLLYGTLAATLIIVGGVSAAVVVMTSGDEEILPERGQEASTAVATQNEPAGSEDTPPVQSPSQREDEGGAQGESPAAGNPNVGAVPSQGAGKGAPNRSDVANRSTQGAEDPDPTPPAAPATGILVVVFGESDAALVAENRVLRAVARAPGLNALDAGSLALVRANEGAVRSALGGDFSVLAGLAIEHGAEFLVVGDLQASAARSAGTFYTGSAALDLRMYQVSTATLVEAEIFRVGSGGVPGKLGQSESDARSQAAEAVSTEAAAAARRWIRNARR